MANLVLLLAIVLAGASVIFSSADEAALGYARQRLPRRALPGAREPSDTRCNAPRQPAQVLIAWFAGGGAYSAS